MEFQTPGTLSVILLKYTTILISTFCRYFYDGQAVDNATVISMRGETYSAPDSKFTLEDADSGSVTDNFSVTNTLPKTSRAYRGEFSLKAPLLTETRKLVPAYLEQIGTSLLELAAKNAWKNPKAKH